jgi:hypothetical protein
MHNERGHARIPAKVTNRVTTLIKQYSFTHDNTHVCLPSLYLLLILIGFVGQPMIFSASAFQMLYGVSCLQAYVLACFPPNVEHTHRNSPPPLHIHWHPCKFLIYFFSFPNKFVDVDHLSHIVYQEEIKNPQLQPIVLQTVLC